MGDVVNKFYQGYLAPSGTNITGVTPAATNYTIKHIVFNNISASGVTISCAYNSLGTASNYIMPSGIVIGAGEWAESTDIYVLNAGDSLFAAASVSGTITATVHGITST